MSTAIRANQSRLRFVALLAFTGAACTADDVILNDPGHDTNDQTVAFAPSLAVRTAASEFLAAWDGDPLADAVADREVRAQRTNAATGAAIDATDITLTSTADASHEVHVAYSAAHDEYLAVWSSQTGGGLFARRIDATTGALLGASAVQVGSTVPSNPFHIAYNSVDDEYLAVWRSAGSVHGQRIDAATGLEVGADDFSIALAGAPTSLAYDSTSNEFLLVRVIASSGFGQVRGYRITGDGSPVDAGEVELLADTGVEVRAPVVTFAPELDWYLLVWSRSDSDPELYGRLMDHDTLAQVGPTSFQITEMGAGYPTTAAFGPQVAWDAGALDFVIAFFGRDGTSLVQADEVFVQRVDGPTAALACPSPFRISDRNPLGAPNYPPDSAYPLALGVVPSSGQVAVAWGGYSATAPNPIPPPPFLLEFDVYADVLVRGCTA